MEQLNFDEAMNKLETILDTLEAEGDKMDPNELEKKIGEAEALKNYCKDLLKKEKEEIIRTAKENDISLEDIGMTEDDDEEDDDDDEEED